MTKLAKTSATHSLTGDNSEIGLSRLPKIGGADPSRTDAALGAALERRAELLAELPKMTSELRQIEKFIATWYEMAGFPTPAAFKRSASKGRVPRVLNRPKEEVAEEALKILFEQGRPIVRAELLDLLADRGITLNGKDPAAVLSTMLWRCQDRVIRSRDGYIPADAIGTVGDQSERTGA